ncbi:MAG: hypothetical protein M1814_004388 [Vezdaea aestivalis]|nr:MAG: hypothetical protein M1814_004388 [Vezdaea aestivalis]
MRPFTPCARQLSSCSRPWVIQALRSLTTSTPHTASAPSDDNPSTASSAAPLTPFPPDPSSPHHSLSTFLTYATTTGLSPSTSVYTGTHFEYTVLYSLRRLGFHLVRCGGRSDAGIDLVGTWLPALPIPSPPRIKVLVQCKALAAGITPAAVREMEGMGAGAPKGWRGEGVLRLMVAGRAATKGVREAMGRSPGAMGFGMIKGGKIEQLVWNRKVEQLGLEEAGVGLRFWEEGEKRGKEVVLIWRGEVIESLDEGSQRWIESNMY